MTSIETLTSAAVVGSGYMGGGIAQMLALHGYKVALGDVDGETAERARVRLVEQARGFEGQGLFPQGAAGVIEGNLASAGSIEEAVAARRLYRRGGPRRADVEGRHSSPDLGCSTVPGDHRHEHLRHPHRRTRRSRCPVPSGSSASTG